MEVVWKVCEEVVSCWLNRSVILHDKLHGLISGRVTGTENLEVNLVQDLAGLTHNPLFRVFLEVCKAYNSLDRGGVYGDFTGVQDVPEHVSPHLSPLGQPTVCTKGDKVYREGVRHRERVHARRPCVPHDI